MNPPRRDTTVPAPNPVPRRKRLKQRISSFNVPRKPSVGEGSSQTTTHAHTLRKGSISSAAGPKAQRTSKTSQKLVVLPEEPQTKPLPGSDEDLTLGYETDAGIRVKEYKNDGEKMSVEQRKRAGFKRITAYCVAETFKLKLLASFLKREHNVGPRVFDEALYVMYHLPLLPGYGPEANVRSSAPPKTSDGKSILNVLSEAEENGYQGSYFVHNNEQSQTPHHDGYLTSSPTDTRNNTTVTTPATPGYYTSASEAEAETDHYASASEAEGVNHEPYSNPDAQTMGSPPEPSTSFPIVSPPGKASQSPEKDDEHAEAVFFEYGVVVFFGFTEVQEKSILEDVHNARIAKRKIPENDWEVEECHFTHDPNIAYPRIYNDFFTLKSRSHLLKLSIAHALAQSTLLAHYESNAQRVLSSPEAFSIPKQLAAKGALQLKRREALKLTGRLFKLRRDVNLVSNVLDVPELFWDEASLKKLYDAVREYMEIGPRVQVLNDKLVMASDFLDAIHDHLNNSAMERITWIIIWLIVVACLVELGEVIARLVVHATTKPEIDVAPVITQLSRAEVLRILDGMSDA
ncbi:Sad1-interacting factor 3 [Marasmius tenuissimus]|uniref:Sad1-interacting factor 3 n=1 Tax=Marasmius tenuissimus TaxID=585030 RepID=A0ABR2ZYT8_9AGAR